MIYYCRVKGEKNWETVPDHPCRPIEGIVLNWARGRSLEDNSLVEFKQTLEGDTTEVKYRK